MVCLAPAGVSAGDPPATQPEKITFQSARQAFLRGEYELAIRSYDQLGKAGAAAAVRAACGRADVDEQLGDYAAGIERLKRVEADGAAGAEWNAALASLYARVGENEKAERHNQQALRLDAKCARARWQLGRMYESLGRFDQAREIYAPFEQAMTANEPLPDRADDLTFLGRGFIRYCTLTRNPEVVRRTKHVLTEVFQEAFEFVDHLYWPARLAAAELLLEKHNLNEAREDFEAIRKTNPRAAAAVVGLGRIALENWDFEAVEKAVEEALKINPRSVAARLLLADLRMTERKYRDAAAAAEEALKTNPRSIESLATLAAAQVRMGDDAAGARTLERIAKLNPRSAVRHYILGRWLAAARQFAEAERELKRAIEYDPTWSEPRAELGEVYMQIGEEDSARRTLEEAYALDSFNGHTFNVLELLDGLAKFSRLETPHFIILYDAAEDAVLAPYLAECLEKLHDDVCDDFRVKLDRKTLIEVFPQHMGFSIRITGRPFIATVGACSGRVIALAAPRAANPFGHYNFASVLRHEFTHTVTLAATNNRIPHWMTEGLAVYEEPYPRGWEQKRLLATAVRDQRLFTLESIDWGFMRPRRADDRSLAYAQSEWMIEFIIQRQGFDKILEMLQRFREGWNQPRVFSEVLKIEPRAFDEQFQAWAAEQARKWAMPLRPDRDAKALSERMEKGEPTASDLAALAEAWLTSQKPNEAEETARQALELDKNEALAIDVLGTVLIYRMLAEKVDTRRSEFAKEALPYVRRLMELQPGNLTAIKHLAYIEQEAKNWDEAVRLLKQYQARFPDDPDSHRRLAGIALTRGGADEARKHLTALARLVDDEAPVAIQLAQLCADAGDWPQAAAWYKKAIQADPYDVETHEKLAVAYQRLGKPADALVEFEAICKLKPRDAAAFENLAAACREAGEKKRAEEAAKEARRLREE